MWTPPLPRTPELKGQLEESGVRLDEKSIEFFALFCGGHRGIFIAAMHWVKSKQAGESWGFSQTVGFVRKSYDNGDWSSSDGILSYMKKSRAIHVNNRYQSLDAIPDSFITMLCSGPCKVNDAGIKKDLCIHGFILPHHEHKNHKEFNEVNWSNHSTKYKVSNPLIAFYYRQVLEQERALRVDFHEGYEQPHSSADLLMRAIPYLPFSKVVSFEAETSELAKDSLPHETQYNQAFHSVLRTMRYQTFAPQSSKEGEGKPDLRVHIGEESFAIEGMKQNIEEHLRRFNIMVNYKNAKHQGLYIIGNDSDKMLETLKNTEAGKVQLIGLVPNIAHTAYTVHVKSKGIERINTCNVDCDLVARRLVLKDNGKPELHSVQSLKSINLSACEDRDGLGARVEGGERRVQAGGQRPANRAYAGKHRLPEEGHQGGEAKSCPMRC
ncbi:unnamed protein product [Effrenium voratum]|nr:unnamed protein product [Effrenium voratum]